jgi:hypothetical protein
MTRDQARRRDAVCSVAAIIKTTTSLSGSPSGTASNRKGIRGEYRGRCVGATAAWWLGGRPRPLRRAPHTRAAPQTPAPPQPPVSTYRAYRAADFLNCRYALRGEPFGFTSPASKRALRCTPVHW